MSTAEQNYFSGNYKKAIQSKNELTSLAFKIGSMVFLGQHQEARILFKTYKEKLSTNQRIIANFHIGISYTRTSNYDLAKKIFKHNQQLLKLVEDDQLAQFFVYQGLSFFTFFFSKHKQSQIFAEKAYAAILKMPHAKPILLALSFDIQGHNLIELGSINKGLDKLKSAWEIADKSKLHDFTDTFKISYVINKSEYTSDVKTQIDILKNIFKDTQEHNDYSRSLLILQIAKLLILTGEFSSAQDFITQHYDVFYKNENKRIIAKLNMIMAQLLVLRGQPLEALTMCRTAMSNLNKTIDIRILLPILGLEKNIMKIINKDTAEQEQTLANFSQQVDNYKNTRIVARENNRQTDYKPGEDTLADVIDEVYKNKDISTLKKIIDLKVHLFLIKYFSLKMGQKYIIISPLKDKLIICDNKGIFIKNVVLSKNFINLMRRLAKGPCDKKSIIETIWAYEYDPLRHDSLIYTTVTRARKSLGEYAEWIMSNEEAYYLQPDVVFLEESSMQASIKKEIPPLHDQAILNLDLNYRQIQTIESIESFISVSEYAKQWDVTKMTALRDLKDLCLKGILKTIGKGRATKYYVS